MQFIYLRKNEKEKKDLNPVAKFIGMLNRIDPCQKSKFSNRTQLNLHLYLIKY